MGGQQKITCRIQNTKKIQSQRKEGASELFKWNLTSNSDKEGSKILCAVEYSHIFLFHPGQMIPLQNPEYHTSIDWDTYVDH